MTYIDLVNRFWKLDKEWNFSSVETKLYFLLLDIANSLAWKNPIRLSNENLSKKFEESEATVRRARNKIAQIGLITFKAAKSKAERSQYFITGIEECDTKNEETRHPNVTNRDTQTTPKSDIITDCTLSSCNENNFERDTQTSPNVTPKSQNRDTQIAPNILRQDIDKNIHPEKENYFVVKEKAPPLTLFDEFFAPERQVDLEALAMNQGVDIPTLKEIAQECLTEWNVTNTTHVDKKDAFKHLVSHIRRKVECRRQSPKVPTGEISERRQAFWKDILSASKMITDEDDNQLFDRTKQEAFYTYWTETDTAGKLMRYEVELFWNTFNRMRQWIARGKPYPIQ